MFGKQKLHLQCVYIILSGTTNIMSTTNLSCGQSSSYCQQITVSGTRYHSQQQGVYQLLEASTWTCVDNTPVYRHTTCGYYLYMYINAGRYYWAVGDTKCQALHYIRSDVTTECAPTDESVWFEAFNNNNVPAQNSFHLSCRNTPAVPVLSCGQSPPYCQQIVISGTRYHIQQQGVYQLLEPNAWTCVANTPVYRHTTCGYYFYMYISAGSYYWAVGDTKCQALHYIRSDVTTKCAPTDESGWFETFRNNNVPVQNSFHLSCRNTPEAPTTRMSSSTTTPTPSPTTPSSYRSPSTTPSGTSSAIVSSPIKGNMIAVSVGVTVGGLVLILLAVLVLCFFNRRRNPRKSPAPAKPVPVGEGTYVEIYDKIKLSLGQSNRPAVVKYAGNTEDDNVLNEYTQTFPTQSSSEKLYSKNKVNGNAYDNVGGE